MIFTKFDCNYSMSQQIGPFWPFRALVSVGAEGAAATKDFQKNWFCTQRFWKRDIYNLDFCDFHSKLTFLSVFFEYFRKSTPTILKFQPGPCLSIKIFCLEYSEFSQIANSQMVILIKWWLSFSCCFSYKSRFSIPLNDGLSYAFQSTDSQMKMFW